METTWDQKIIAPLIRRMLRHDLQRAFRRVCWIGPIPELPADTPVGLYANHHNYYDGHLLWLLVSELLNRPCTLWMREWERFPFFAALGAQPFPSDAPAERVATIRRTRQRLRDRPSTVLIYFPEGGLRSPDRGLGAFSEDVFTRLDRILPSRRWWPVGIHVHWSHEARPTALLTGGEPHPVSHQRERNCLRELMFALKRSDPSAGQVLLEGRRGSSERWNFSFLSSLCQRYL